MSTSALPTPTIWEMAAINARSSWSTSSAGSAIASVAAGPAGGASDWTARSLPSRCPRSIKTIPMRTRRINPRGELPGSVLGPSLRDRSVSRANHCFQKSVSMSPTCFHLPSTLLSTLPDNPDPLAGKTGQKTFNQTPYPTFDRLVNAFVAEGPAAASPPPPRRCLDPANSMVTSA